MAFPTPELAWGIGPNRGWNADRDSDDCLLRYKRLTTGQVVNTGLVVSCAAGEIDIYEQTIVFVSQGGRIRYYDIGTGTVKDVGASGTHPSLSGGLIAFATEEGAIGQDLNGDGDRNDPIVQIYRIKAQEQLEPLAVRAILGYPRPAHGPVHFLVQGEGIREVRAQIYNLAGREGYDSGYLCCVE
mgnify:FL=1